MALSYNIKYMALTKRPSESQVCNFSPPTKSVCVWGGLWQRKTRNLQFFILTNVSVRKNNLGMWALCSASKTHNLLWWEKCKKIFHELWNCLICDFGVGESSYIGVLERYIFGRKIFLLLAKRKFTRVKISVVRGFRVHGRKGSVARSLTNVPNKQKFQATWNKSFIILQQ